MAESRVYSWLIVCTAIKVQECRESKGTESLHLCRQSLMRSRKVAGLEGEGRLGGNCQSVQKVCRPGRFNYYPHSAEEESEAWRSHPIAIGWWNQAF